jgi:hypothetical protein
MNILTVYKRALKLGQLKHRNASDQQHRSFAAAVAQLCCDDPEIPLNKRETYLVDLMKLSKGPTCRESAAIWAAYGKGDAVRGQHENMTIFCTDQRFKRPGTWDYEEAVNHCEEYCYGPITRFHLEVYETDPCFDDDPKDLKQLTRLSNVDPL